MVPELKLERVRFRVWRGADLRLRGAAQALTLRRDSTELAATDLAAELPRNPQPIEITAPAGEGVLIQRTFEVHGGVTMSQGANVARTASARFAPVPAPVALAGPSVGAAPGPAPGGAARSTKTDATRVTGTDPVVVTGPAYVLHGTGFVLDPQTGDLDLSGPVQIDIHPRTP